jgi:hypothetical protein
MCLWGSSRNTSLILYDTEQKHLKIKPIHTKAEQIIAAAPLHMDRNIYILEYSSAWLAVVAVLLSFFTAPPLRVNGITFRFPTWLVWAILFRTSGKFGDSCFSLTDFSPRFRSLLCWFSWLSTLRIDIYQCSSPLFFFSVCVFLLYFWGVMLMISGEF